MMTFTSPVCSVAVRETPSSSNKTKALLSANDEARKTLNEWNLDPDGDLSAATCAWYSSPLLSSHMIAIPYGERASRPMIIFAHMNDLPTMQYILKTEVTKKGNNKSAKDLLTATDDFGLFPLYTAISEPHHDDDVLRVVKWLVSNGADVRQTLANLYTPFSRACFKGYAKVAQWLVIEGGAFLQHGTFKIDWAQRHMQPLRMSHDTCGCSWTSAAEANRIHQGLFVWAERVLKTRRDFIWVLWGSHHRSVRGSLSSLEALSGHAGLLQHIASYAGVETRTSILTTARGLIQHRVWYQQACALDEPAQEYRCLKIATDA